MENQKQVEDNSQWRHCYTKGCYHGARLLQQPNHFWNWSAIYTIVNDSKGASTKIEPSPRHVANRTLLIGWHLINDFNSFVLWSCIKLNKAETTMQMFQALLGICFYGFTMILVEHFLLRCWQNRNDMGSTTMQQIYVKGPCPKLSFKSQQCVVVMLYVDMII